MKNKPFLQTCYKNFFIRKKKIKSILKKIISNIYQGYTSTLIQETKKFFYKKKKNKVKYIKKYLIKNKIAIKNNQKKKSFPIILWKNHLYTQKMWIAEKKFISFLLTNKINLKIKTKKYKKTLNNLFNEDKLNEKKAAILIFLINKISFILGGPGTGKTTMIAQLIIAFIRIKKKYGIILIAPTGKAAIKLKNSLYECIKNLKINKKEKKIFPTEVTTIHSFLNSKKNKINLLIVDETSMIDIILMQKIINLLKKNTKVVFIGDPNQIGPIEPGKILQDIYFFSKFSYHSKIIKKIKKITKIKMKEKHDNPHFLKNSIFLLKKNYRLKKKTGILHFSKFFLKNKKEKIQKIIKKNKKNIKFFKLKTKNYKKKIQKIKKKYFHYFNEIKKKSHPAKIINIFQKIRILCFTNKNHYGVKTINKIFEKNIKYKKKNNKWYEGRPILITKNNKFLNIFNGDIGITLKNKLKKMRVYFLKNKKQVFSLPINLIENYQTSWAITIHKSQGSEFEKVFLIIPKKIKNFFLSKELIYTAITRSKKKLRIYGSKKFFFNSQNIKKKRISGLIKKIKLVAGAGFEPTTFGL